MAAQFPGALVTTTQLPNTRLDATTAVTNHIADHNNMADEMIAVQAELGTNPSAAHSTVAVATAALMGVWRPMFNAHVNLSAAVAGTYVAHNDVTTNVLIGAASPQGYTVPFQYLDPANYAVTGYTLKYRVVASFSQNAVNNAGTSVMTAGLYPYVGDGATTTWLATLGTVTAGSTAALTGGVAGSESAVVSSTFTAPAATTYALALVVSVATTAGSTRANIRLEYSYA